MSESMSYLRKNQKVILAVTGVICIITFTVGSFILQWEQNSAMNAPGEVTVVNWKGGRVSEKDMLHLMKSHYLATEATRNVALMAVQKGAIPYGYDVDIDFQRGRFRFGIEQGRTEGDVVTLMILANKAKSLGMSVSDEAVKQFFSRLAGAPNSGLTDGDIKKVLQETLGENMTLAQFFEQMKTELLAQNMRYLARTGVYSLTPSEAFSYFERLNRSAQIESFPVKVADFVDQVKAKPSDAQLRELYDKYKNYIARPDMPEPGFRVPRKVALEFVKVDFAKLVEEEKAKITEEQIKAEYEKRVAAGDFKAAALPDLPETTPENKDPEKKEPEDKDPAAKPDDAEKMPADEAKPDDAKSDKKDEEAKEDKPADESDKKDDTKKDDTKKDKGAALPNGEVFVLAQDEAAPDAGKKKADEPKVEEKKEDEKKGDDAKPADEEKKGDEVTKPDAAAAPAPETKVQPLEKVRDSILVSLAREPAQKRMDAAFDIVRKAVIKYGRETLAARNAHKHDEKKPAPKPFDLAKVAKEAGLEYGSIPLTDQFKIEEHELGKTSSRSSGGFGGSLPFVNTAFDPGKNLFTPEQSFRNDNEFVFWLTDEKADFVPEFEEESTKKAVAEAWTFREARKLAEAEAKKLAEEVSPGKSLKDSFIDRTVTESALFTWLTPGFTPFGFGEPQLSEVKGVEMAGMDFMRKVFNLKVGEAGAAPNQPETIFYVVRPLKFSPDEKLLREMFAGNGTASSAQRVFMSIASIAQRERAQIERQWLDDLEKEYKVTWVRDARMENAEM